MASLVLPDYRPTLSEVLARRRPSVRWAIVGLLGALVAGTAAWLVLPHRSGVRYVHAAAPAFNLRYGAAFHRLAPERGELVHLRRRAGGRTLDSFAATPLALPAHRGDVAGVLPVLAEGVLAELRTAYPGLTLVEEGKARVGEIAGYSLLFRVGSGSRRMFGREVLLGGPLPGSRGGMRLSLRTWRGSGVRQARGLGTVGALRSPYRSFRYGTEAA